MKKLICVVATLLLYPKSEAQYQSLAQWLSLSRNGGIKQPDAFAILSNHAALADLEKAELFVSTERKYNVKELTCIQFGYAAPYKNFALGAAISFMGNVNKSLVAGAFMVARHLNKIDLGIKFNYMLLAASLYNTLAVLVPEMGIMIHLTKQLGIGMKATNPSGITWNTSFNKDKIPVIYSLQWCYEMASQAIGCFEISKEMDQRISVAASLSYAIYPTIKCCMGVANNGDNIRLATAWTKRRLELGIISDFHNALGYTGGLTLLYTLND